MSASLSHTNLRDLLNYSLGYIKLINPSFSRYRIFTETLTSDILDPTSIFSTEHQEDQILLHLNEFYELTPKELTEENREKYLAQKALAKKLEEIRNRYKIDEYTKQINLNFGYFNVEVPEDINLADQDDEFNKSPKKQNDHPLFSIPIEITVINGKYYIHFLDQNITPNIGFLQNILQESSYYEFSDLINHLENESQLTLPLEKSVVIQIWEELKSKLKLSDVRFDENSFDIEKFIISLSSKSNYFMVQDLKHLTEMSEEELLETSLGSWVQEDNSLGSNNLSDTNSELFFPFKYDKHQLKALGIINNRVSIVQGPPGTGKSQTIANLICHLAANGKRILFLSQKAQALKVVKDKLKELEIEYLFGYIPNRFSHIYNPLEERDGATYTLSGINEYVSFLHDGQKLPEDTNPLAIKETETQFNNSLEYQRIFYKLYNKRISLEDYNINPPSSEKFLDRFNEDKYKQLKQLQEENIDLTNLCGKYIRDTSNLKSLEKKFELLSAETNKYSEILDILINEVEKKGYDRGNPFINFISDRILLYQTGHITKQLPREIYESFESVVVQNLSRKETVKPLKELREFFYYKECCNKIQENLEQFNILLVELGLDEPSLHNLDRIIQKHDFQSSIEKAKEFLILTKELHNLHITNLNSITQEFHKVKETHQEKVKNFIKNRVKEQVTEAVYSNTIRGVVARIARALQKSKRAYKTFDELKKDPTNFHTLKEIVPIWIMDLEDASRLIPLESNLFDYIILDEASQCNLAHAIPAMFRSQHVIFFGDSEQMRDDSIKFKTNNALLELARKNKIPNHLQIKSKDDSVKSVMDIGNLCGFKSSTLLYHYRSPKELINFSNENFYAPKKKRMEVINTNYLTYKDTDRIMVNHFVNPTRELDTSEKTNIAEAKYIADLIKKLQSDDKTKNKSIGVLTFFSEQAYLLKEIINDESIKISVIEGIQGDERDIIIYSFVICSSEEKKRYIPLTGEQGEINKDLNAGRVNVAFSRARQQVHCVTSMTIDQWPDGIWIKRYLEYIELNGKVNFYNQKLNKFDSHFEEEFYYLIHNEFGKKFIIQNQVESCGFRIDFVISDPFSSARVAIECDGPTHFEDENSDIYISSDFERQSILESAGWVFYRISYSDWIDEKFDKRSIIKSVDYYMSRQ